MIEDVNTTIQRYLDKYKTGHTVISTTYNIQGTFDIYIDGRPSKKDYMAIDECGSKEHLEINDIYTSILYE